VASNGIETIEGCDKHFNLSFTRSPFTLNNLKAYFNLKKIIKENKYQYVHCHTPVGGVLTRLAARKAKCKVIYTAHGFHFHKGAPIKMWLMYYPVEKFLAKYTDLLITINEEDYNLAKNKFKKTTVKLVHGVGVNEEKFINKELRINKEDYIFLSIGELNKNKNHIMQIESMKKLVKQYPKAKLLIAGEGALKPFYLDLIKKYNLQNNVKLLGYRKDIASLLNYSDCVIATSMREGLPVNVIEAMFCSKPIIATNIRGHKDLIKKEQLVDLNNIEELTNKMKEYVSANKQVQNYDIEKYKIENVLKEIEEAKENIND